jgi:hypothetical protein
LDALALTINVRVLIEVARMVAEEILMKRPSTAVRSDVYIEKRAR